MALKTLDWYQQNPAINRFTPTVASKFSTNSLFVIGRNIYQAACGNSRSALSYLDDFATRTQGLEKRKQKALLDGILFEIFFDSMTRLREFPKVRCFKDAFDLQQYDELSDSFKFIAECLLPQGNRFYVIPGKDHMVAVDVVTRKKDSNVHVLKGVFFAGVDILRSEQDEDEDKGSSHYEKLGLDEFESRLSKEMLVPLHLLRVTYSFERSSKVTLLFPLGWSTRKVNQ